MRRDDERPYTIDDLVSHEKRQMGFVLLILVAAMVYFAGQRLVGPPDEAPRPDAAPVGSSSGR